METKAYPMNFPDKQKSGLRLPRTDAAGGNKFQNFDIRAIYTDPLIKKQGKQHVNIYRLPGFYSSIEKKKQTSTITEA